MDIKRSGVIVLFILWVVLSVVMLNWKVNEIERLNGNIDALSKEYKIKSSEYDGIIEKYIALEEENENLQLRISELEKENEKLRTIRAKITAYSPLDNVDGQQAQGNPSMTSIGRRVGRNIVASDPRKLPYGTLLEIDGYGQVEVGDTGGALRNDNKNIRIDVYKDTYKEALDFGVKDMEVKIIKWGK